MRVTGTVKGNLRNIGRITVKAGMVSSRFDG